MVVPEVVIYTDGGCHPNPGPGGWGAILLFPDRQPKEISGSAQKTTNNRMELQAALEALQTLSERHRVELYTDSQYLRQGITQWLPAWKKRGWKTKGETAVKNRDLWQALAAQVQGHDISWHWTKGHANDKWNERADQLARSAIPALPLPLDDDQAVHIFTAASYRGKTKRGGCGVVLRYRDQVKTLHQSAENTSANRMHIQSAILGLEAITKPLPVHLYTSSDYLKDGATLWVRNWAARDWKTKEGKAVSHRDLWERLVALAQSHQVSWHVVDKAHLPDEMAQAKQVANQAAQEM